MVIFMDTYHVKREQEVNRWRKLGHPSHSNTFLPAFFWFGGGVLNFALLLYTFECSNSILCLLWHISFFSNDLILGRVGGFDAKEGGIDKDLFY